MHFANVGNVAMERFVRRAKENMMEVTAQFHADPKVRDRLRLMAHREMDGHAPDHWQAARDVRLHCTMARGYSQPDHHQVTRHTTVVLVSTFFV
jgi:hypothetical protein